MSIRSNVIISTVTALFVSNAVVFILCTWLQCTPCGSRQSSFVHNAPSFEPAALPETAGLCPLSTPSYQLLLNPGAAEMPLTADFIHFDRISLADPPVHSYQTGRIGVHLSTGPPFADLPYYIYKYGEGTIRFSFQGTVAASFYEGAFAVFSSGDFSFERGHIRYAADYSFNTMIA